MAVRTGKDITWTYNSQAFLVLTAGNFKRNKKIEDNTPFGVQDQTQASAVLRSLDDLPIEVEYDDGGTIDGVFQAAYLADVAYTLLVTWGGTKTSSVSALVKAYERLPKVGSRTREKVTLAFTGAVTEV